ncbi:MAG: hypothetical protein ACUVTR_06690 [Dehalococcoidia bacterium]
MKISARNMPKGRVKHSKLDAANTEALKELPRGCKIVSIVTRE